MLVIHLHSYTCLCQARSWPETVSCPRDLCRKTCCGGTAWPLLSTAPRPGKGIVAPEVGEMQSELLTLPGPWVGEAQPSPDLAIAIKECVPSLTRPQ